MAKKLYEIIMETLGIGSKEEANALRIKNHVTFATVDEFCKKYAEEHQKPIAGINIVKGDIVIRDISCRIWLNKKNLSGIVKLSDDSDKKLLSFEWGKNHKGEWFKDPKVVQGNTQLRYTGHYVYDQVLKEWTILMDEPNKRNYDVIMAVKDAIARLYRQKAA